MKIYLDNDGQQGEGLLQLLDVLDGIPVAIVLMAYQGQNRSPAELVKSYEEERTALLTRGRRTRITSLEVSVTITLNCQTMKEEPSAIGVLGLLWLLPDGVGDTQLRKASRNVPGRESAVRVLEQVALLVRSGNRRKVLAPVREFILTTYVPIGQYWEELRD